MENIIFRGINFVIEESVRPECFECKYANLSPFDAAKTIYDNIYELVRMTPAARRVVRRTARRTVRRRRVV